MGILKNYDIINPFVSWTNDAFNRLKPGFEAPVCVVTSLGHSVQSPSRNRTVLVGLVRDTSNPLATRFEIRSPNPKSNTYLICASAYMAMLDGIKAALGEEKTAKELEKSISKNYGEKDFYLETDRIYRSEKNIFEEYSQQERDKYFGFVPGTVWENIKTLDASNERTKILEADDVMRRVTLESYQEAVISQWRLELHDRIVPNVKDLIRQTVRIHGETGNDLDESLWQEVNALRHEIGKDSIKYK